MNRKEQERKCDAMQGMRVNDDESDNLSCFACLHGQGSSAIAENRLQVVCILRICAPTSEWPTVQKRTRERAGGRVEVTSAQKQSRIKVIQSCSGSIATAFTKARIII